MVKYNRDGEQQWIQQYNGDGYGDDVGTGLYIDGGGNVYVTGFSTTTSGIDIITIKYNSSGTQQWLTTYDGTGGNYDSGADITVDGSGNVYITGSSYNANANTDIMAIKYNSGGTEQWASSYDGDTHMNDAGIKILLDDQGGVVISAITQYNIITYKICAITYNAGNGNLISAVTSGSASTGIDQVNDMVKDASGNIYIAGAIPVIGQGYDYDVIKLNSNLGIDWEQTYNGADDLDDIATGIKTDASGNVYVTGYTNIINGR